MGAVWQSEATTVANLTATANATKPSGASTNDLLIAICVSSGGTTWGAPSGWNASAGTNMSGSGWATFWRIVGSSPGSDGATYPFSTGNALINHNVMILRFSGAHLTAPIDDARTLVGAPISVNQSVSAITAVNADTTIYDTMLFITSASPTCTPPNTQDFNANASPNRRRAGGHTYGVGAGSSGARNWTNTSSGAIVSVFAIRSDSTAHSLTPSDTATVTDAPSKDVGKFLADGATASDAASKGVGKGLADAVTATDAVTSKTIGKGVADAVTATDAPSKAVGRPLADGVTATDVASVEPGKNLADGATVTDASALAIGKGLDDPVTVTDAVARDVGKPLSDSVTTTDAPSKAVGKPLADSVTVSDAAVVSLGFAVGPADTVTVTDAPSKSIGLYLSDSATATDAVDLVTGTEVSLSDAVTVTDQITVSLGINLSLSDTVGCTADFPVTTPTRNIGGYVYDHESDPPGTPILGATVRLFRTQDDALCQVTSTDGTGRYEFLRDAADPYTYYVTAEYTAGPAQVHGISDRGLIPEPV